MGINQEQSICYDFSSFKRLVFSNLNFDYLDLNNLNFVGTPFSGPIFSWTSPSHMIDLSGSTDDSNNIEGSMNTVFIPELDHEHFVLQQQQ